MAHPYVRLIPPGSELPGRFPWLPKQVVSSVTPVRDSDGNITAVEMITTQGQFVIPPLTRVAFPMRDDASHVDWRERDHAPRMAEIAIGDILPAQYPMGPDDYLVATKMVSQSMADTQFVFLYTYRHMTMHTQKWNCHQMVPFENPVIEVIPEIRRGKALRGPYEDVETEARYFFHVHPSGKGRWPADVPVFEYKDGGEHNSRPPAIVTSKENQWHRLKFIGGNNSDRHPNDPIVMAAKRGILYRQREGY